MNIKIKWFLILLIQIFLFLLNLGLAYDDLNLHIDKLNMFCSGLIFGGMILCYFGFRFEKLKIEIKEEKKRVSLKI